MGSDKVRFVSEQLHKRYSIITVGDREGRKRMSAKGENVGKRRSAPMQVTVTYAAGPNAPHQEKTQAVREPDRHQPQSPVSGRATTVPGGAESFQQPAP